MDSPRRATLACRSRRRPAGRRSLNRGLGADLPVKLLDHRVPGRDRAAQLPPELLGSPRLEFWQGDPLLLDPGVVAKVQDTVAIRLGQFEQMIGRNAREVLPE